ETMEFMFDPRDITVLYGRTPDGMTHRLMPTDPSIPRMSRGEWLTRQKLRRAAGNHPMEVAAVEIGLLNQYELIHKANRTTKWERRGLAKTRERQKAVARDHGAIQVPTSESEHPSCIGELPLIELPVEDGSPVKKH